MSEECTVCGEEIEDDEAVWVQDGLKKEGKERLKNGEKVGFDELFTFADGPYCSLDCKMKEEKE